MVLLHVKYSELNQFLFKTTVNESIDNIYKELIEVSNLRVKLDRLIQTIEGLADYGVLRPEALRGLTTPETYNPAVEMLTQEEKKYAYPEPNSSQKCNIDKTGFRIGICPVDSVSEMMKTECSKAKELLKPDMVQKKTPISKEILQDIINLLKGAVMIAYPGYHGMPNWDYTYLILEDKFDFNTYYPDSNYFTEAEVIIWWAGKELTRNKKLSDFIGKNENSKILIKINKKESGAPTREPPIDQETHKKMLAYYYKKQEEHKKLETNHEDDYLDSEWANPKNLKNQLLNNKGVNWKPF